jgi:di/tricarboxylate transporter
VAEAIGPQLTKLPAMVQVIALGTFVLLVTTFVSHTVGAIILTPMVVSVGKVRDPWIWGGCLKRENDAIVDRLNNYL